MRRNRACALIAAIAVSVMSMSCMQPAEPTPVSKLVLIVPRTESVRILGGGTSASLSTVLHVDVLGERSMFLSDSWDLEKLVDQKWRLAFSNTGSPISQIVTPSRGASIAPQIIFTRVPVSNNPFFRNPAGIYRVHLQLTYADGARESLPPDQTYSPPFSVIE